MEGRDEVVFLKMTLCTTEEKFLWGGCVVGIDRHDGRDKWSHSVTK